MEGNVTLISIFMRWCRVVERAAATRESYGFALRRLEREGWFATVEDVTVERLARFVAARAEGVKATTINGDLDAIFVCLGLLERENAFPLERLRELRRQRVLVQRPRRFTAPSLAFDQVEDLCLAARAIASEPKPKGGRVSAGRGDLFLRVAFLAGLRGGELARVAWEEIDLSRRRLRVRFRPELGRAGAAKTGERTVPLCRELVELLELERAQVLLERGEASGFLFRHGSRARRNACAGRKTLWRELKVACARSGIRATFHLTRHTRASTWLQAGVSLAKVAKWLGDDPETIARFYGGLVEGYDADCEIGARPRAAA